MKYRLGFVTNSSSSSYICAFCGDIQSGWDASLSDVDMCECENGHVLCNCHVNFNITDEEKKEVVKKYYKETLETYNKKLGKDKFYNDWATEVIEKCNEILTGIEELEKDSLGATTFGELWVMIEKEYELILEETGISTKLCPVCQFESLTDYDALKYMFKKYGTSLEKVRLEIKERFKSYEEFQKEILER